MVGQLDLGEYGHRAEMNVPRHSGKPDPVTGTAPLQNRVLTAWLMKDASSKPEVLELVSMAEPENTNVHGDVVRTCFRMMPRRCCGRMHGAINPSSEAPAADPQN